MLDVLYGLPVTAQALLATLFTWGLTAAGAGMVFFTRELNRKVLAWMLGFAAGVMVAASYWSLLAPAIEMSGQMEGVPAWFPATAGFLLGAVFLRGIDLVLPHLHLGLGRDQAEGIKTTWQRSVLLVLAITLHNIPEGLAIGVAFGAAAAGLPSATLAGAVALAIGVGIQNFPEGAAVALPLAVLIHRSRWVNAAVTPFLGATQAIPAIALAPLLVLWVGYGLRSVVLLCALLVFFPILVASVVGLRHLDPSVIDAARMDGAASAALLTQIELPLALPSILAGLRNGFTLSVTGAVVGEMVMGGDGLGQLLTIQRDSLDTAGMFATIVVLCALASLAYGLIQLVERRSKVMQALSGSSRQ